MNMMSPRFFRSYQVRAHQDVHCKIWQAAQAIMALPGFSLPVDLGDNTTNVPESFTSASIRYNNPVEYMHGEVAAIYDKQHPVTCVVNIGAGNPGIIQSPFSHDQEELLDVFRRLLNDTESPAQRFGSHYPRLFFRFNVEHGFQRDASAATVTTHTTSYLDLAETIRRIDSLVKKLLRDEAPLFVVGSGKLNPYLSFCA